MYSGIEEIFWKTLVPEASFSWNGVNGLPAVPLLTLGSVPEAAPNPPGAAEELAPKGDELVGVPNPPKDGFEADPNNPPPPVAPGAPVLVVEAPNPDPALELPNADPVLEAPNADPVLLLANGDELVLEDPKTDPVLLLAPNADVELPVLDPKALPVLALLPNTPPEEAAPGAPGAFRAPVAAPKGEPVGLFVVDELKGEPVVVLLAPKPPKPVFELPNMFWLMLLKVFSLCADCIVEL